mmetsp:Transcript_155292/g.498281  ORF Transcript_155292/g.498281 Transcript_155292/m.498281 type:complete len:202 (+) Transcript_155292:3-608(+)
MSVVVATAAALWLKLKADSCSEVCLNSLGPRLLALAAPNGSPTSALLAFCLCATASATRRLHRRRRGIAGAGPCITRRASATSAAPSAAPSRQVAYSSRNHRRCLPLHPQPGRTGAGCAAGSSCWLVCGLVSVRVDEADQWRQRACIGPGNRASQPCWDVFQKATPDAPGDDGDDAMARGQGWLELRSFCRELEDAQLSGG